MRRHNDGGARANANNRTSPSRNHPSHNRSRNQTRPHHINPNQPHPHPLIHLIKVHRPGIRHPDVVDQNPDLQTPYRLLHPVDLRGHVGPGEVELE